MVSEEGVVDRRIGDPLLCLAPFKPFLCVLNVPCDTMADVVFLLLFLSTTKVTLVRTSSRSSTRTPR